MNEAGALTTSERVWARDVTLWGEPGTPEIADRLGWLDIADRMLPLAGELEAWAGQIRESGLTNVVLLGMGGSSLGPEVLASTYGVDLTMLDSTDPDAVLGAVDSADLARTIFIVSSKSGGTIETLSHFKHFYELTGGNGAQFCAVTDPGSPLEQLAGEHGFCKVWLADPEIGGRYSVLSYFGLVPAALAGIPLTPLLERAVSAAESCRAPERNPGLLIGEKFGELARNGRDKLTFVVDPPFESFGLWVEQLVAESTGKRGRGMLPVAGEPLPDAAEVDEFGGDRVFVHIANSDQPHAANGELMQALELSAQPVFQLATSGPEDLGRLMFAFEFAIAVLGHELMINPFDQPNVQEAKDATKRVLASGDVALEFDSIKELAALLADASVPGYVAIMGYLEPGEPFEAAVSDLRQVIRAQTGVATTFGYGPRFLHSTGQLHKGGPPNGRFIQLIHDSGNDAAIPGESYGFRTLKHAQAIGDLEALKAHGRSAVCLELVGDATAALRSLIAELI